MEPMTVDINCDLGEGATLADCQRDVQIMALIDRCNIACGGHAGNAEIMQQSLQNAAALKLRTGAHPGYADKANFGRVSMLLDWSELEQMLLAQLNEFFTQANRIGVTVSHIKLHGALYNDTEQSPQLAQQITALCQRHYPGVALLGIANGCLQSACKQAQVPFIREGFIDRRYLDNGLLVPRSQPGAVLTEVSEIVEQAVNLAQGKGVICHSGKPLALQVDSLCLHGDSPLALAVAQALKKRL